MREVFVVPLGEVPDGIKSIPDIHDKKTFYKSLKALDRCADLHNKCSACLIRNTCESVYDRILDTIGHGLDERVPK